MAVHDFKTELVDQGELTPREGEVLLLMLNALSDKDISRALALSLKTVTAHIEHIYCKLGVRGESLNRRMCVLRVALARGMVRLMSFVLCVSMVTGDQDLFRSRTRSKTGGRVSVSRRLS